MALYPQHKNDVVRTLPMVTHKEEKRRAFRMIVFGIFYVPLLSP